jgi:Phage tail tube protein
MPSPGSGLTYQLGTGVEATYGTLVAVTQFLPAASGEIKHTPNFEQGEGLRAGATLEDIGDRVWTTSKVGGSIKHPVYQTGFNRWIGSLFGSLATTPVSHTPAYTWTHSWQRQQGNSLTLQEGIPLRSGSLQRWDVPGTKVSQADFALDASGLLQATYTVVSMDRVMNASAVTAVSATAVKPFAWQMATVKLGTLGSETAAANITKAAWSYKRTLKDDSFWLGNVSTDAAAYGVIGEPLDNGFAAITGTLDTEYMTEAAYVDLFRTQAKLSMIIDFKAATAITGIYYPEITFNFPVCVFDDGQGTVPGPDVVQPQVSFKALLDSVAGTAAPSVVVTSTEAAI